MNFKTVLFTTCVCLSFVTVVAQDEDAFSIGPRIGVNFSNVNNIETSEATTGLVFGLTSTYSLSEATGITVDLLYSQEGYKLESVDDEVNVDYLRIPIYFDFFFGDLGEAFRPKVYVGLAPGILLKAETANFDMKEMTNSFVVDLSGGLGFNYRIANRVWLNVDARSFIGLSDIRHEDFRPGDNDKIANRTVQISTGVAFGL